jgi:hypothetical protein
LKRQARLAKTLGKRGDVLAFDVRPPATDRGFGMLIGGLTVEEADTGLHEGGEPWQDLLEHCRGHLTFVQQWAFAKGVSRLHGTLLL